MHGALNIGHKRLSSTAALFFLTLGQLEMIAWMRRRTPTCFSRFFSLNTPSSSSAFLRPEHVRRRHSWDLCWAQDAPPLRNRRSGNDRRCFTLYDCCPFTHKGESGREIRGNNGLFSFHLVFLVTRRCS